MFGINKNTGTVYSKAIIDRESDFATYGTFILGKDLCISKQFVNNFFLLGLSATEVDRDGLRGQSVTTEVTIIVSVSFASKNFQPPQNMYNGYVVCCQCV